LSLANSPFVTGKFQNCYLGAGRAGSLSSC
jgi:hypothetical protein